MLQCLENIVGISESDCPCIVDGLTTAQRDAMKLSTSGLYIEDAPGGIELRTLNNVDACRKLYDIMMKERDVAIDWAEKDLIVALSKRAKKAVKPYVGGIGWPSYAVTLPNPQQFQGLRLTPLHHTDATVIINRIRLAGNQAAALNVYIVKTYHGSGRDAEIVFSAPVNTVMNNYATVTLPAGGISLPLREDNVVLEYWVYFDKALTAFLAKDTQLGCNCGSNASTLNDYFDIRGVGFTNPSDMIESGRFDTYSHGFVLDVELKCESKTLICREVFENEKIGIAMAAAVQFKAAELIIESVLKSNEVNRFTMQNREYNWGKRNHFRVEYASRISYMAGEIDISNSDCFVCGGNAMFFTKIRG